MIPPATLEALLVAYPEHAAEYRLQVQLGWDRLRFFLALNVALFVFGRGAAEYYAGALASLLGGYIVLRTHQYYRNARDAFQRIEHELLLSSFPMSTTRPRSALKITTAGVIVLMAFAALDVALATLALVGGP